MATKGKSKFLSLVLRHRPEIIGVSLDHEGYVDIETLINCLNNREREQKSIPFTRETVLEIVANCSKQRFQLNSDGTKIRACQGHSIPVDLGLNPIKPPDQLFHGTCRDSLQEILSTGLKSMSRQYVHLSTNRETANNVGRRHGELVLLSIDTRSMYGDGIKHYLANNGVWLVDYVDPKYISIVN